MTNKQKLRKFEIALEKVKVETTKKNIIKFIESNDFKNFYEDYFIEGEYIDTITRELLMVLIKKYDQLFFNVLCAVSCYDSDVYNMINNIVEIRDFWRF